MATLCLLNLRCIASRRGMVECDNPVIKVWSTRYRQWENTGMRTGKDWNLHAAVPVVNQVRIELWEMDWGAWCPHENDLKLGMHVITTDHLRSGLHTIPFHAGDANYLLTYEAVVSETN